MTLSPLEIVLATGLVALITALAVRIWMGRNCITRHECELKHRQEQKDQERLVAEDEEARKEIKSIKRMLVAAIQHLPIEDGQKTKIINDGGV